MIDRSALLGTSRCNIDARTVAHIATHKTRIITHTHTHNTHATCRGTASHILRHRHRQRHRHRERGVWHRQGDKTSAGTRLNHASRDGTSSSLPCACMQPYASMSTYPLRSFPQPRACARTHTHTPRARTPYREEEARWSGNARLWTQTTVEWPVREDTRREYESERASERASERERARAQAGEPAGEPARGAEREKRKPGVHMNNHHLRSKGPASTRLPNDTHMHTHTHTHTHTTTTSHITHHTHHTHHTLTHTQRMQSRGLKSALSSLKQASGSIRRT